MSFDPAALLEVLPHHPVAYPSIARTLARPKWYGSAVGPYNGFTPEERLSHWQLSVILRRLGVFPSPAVCDLCRSTKRIGWHAEHYGDLARSVGLCWPCHMALHQRFVSPMAWRSRIDRNLGAAAWVVLIAAKPFNFAGWAAAHLGASARDPWRELS